MNPRVFSLLMVLSLALRLFAETGSVIFIHPDGTGLGHWNAARHLAHGPDGFLHWDRLERLAAYRPHQKGWLSTSSNAGGVTHAYGVKVPPSSYGLMDGKPVVSASGKPLSIMREAMQAGIRCGIVNTGHIGEPGTGAFLAVVEQRKDVLAIADQIVHSGADVIFCGGEVFLLPAGQRGVHGEEGLREDGRNLLEEARALGYTVIHTREELLNLPADTRRVLGVFAALNTYNDKTEEALREAGLPTYQPTAPTFAEMTEVALRVLANDPATPFFLMAEEEGTDNFSNALNARGMLDATLRADAAIGVARRFLEAHPERRVLLLVGSDSDAGHPGIWTPHREDRDQPLPPHTSSGSALDGAEGTGTPPFVTPPDGFGQAHFFGIAWGYSEDLPGSVVTKAHGFRADRLPSTIDNTGIYRILYEVLFGAPPVAAP